MNTDTKIALVTGANKGIGLEIARQLGHAGLTVLVGARDTKRGAQAAQTLRDEGLDARPLHLDVTHPESIEAAAQTIERDWGKLDVLVNNAGIAVEAASASQTSMAALRETFETNFFGAFAIAHALLPLLCKAEAARIVNMSSDLSSLTLSADPNWEFSRVNAFAYSASKTALNALTMSLARELRDTKIKVNSVTPGYTATDLNPHQGTRTIEQGAREPIRLALLDENGPTAGFFDECATLPW